MTKTSVLIVDDHTLISETWARLLRLSAEFEVLGNTDNGETAISIAKQLRPAIVLLDINMQPLDGFAILKLIRKFSPGSKIIAVSMHTQPLFAKKMFKGGAKGYVTKTSTSAEWLKAIREVNAGRTFICSQVKETLAQQSIDGKNVSLTERELEIIRLLKKGLSSKRIAEILGVSKKTVEVHRSNVLKKLGLTNTAAIIQYANDNGLI